jgi:hypothetical protein
MKLRLPAQRGRKNHPEADKVVVHLMGCAISAEKLGTKEKIAEVEKAVEKVHARVVVNHPIAATNDVSNLTPATHGEWMTTNGFDPTSPATFVVKLDIQVTSAHS